MLKNLRLDPLVIFNNNYQKQELRQTVVKGSLALIVSQGVSFALSIVNTLVLARLLTPSDFGLVGMVTVVVNFLAMFKDAGLSTATIQNEKIGPDQISTLFWINVLISVGLGLIILFASPFIASFYKKPELTAVTAVLSLSFILQGLSIQHIALLQRHLRFISVAINDISALLVNIIVASVMAALGCRYWALVGGTIASTFTLLIMTFNSCPWIPGKMRKKTGVRKMLSFGGHLTVTSIVHYFSRNLDSILIGRFIGAEPLGLYSRAFNLLMSPLNQIRAPLTTLSLPVLSSLKNDSERYRSYYRQLLDVSISLTLPISVYCFIESEFIIRLLLGSKWINAVPVFRIFSIAGVFVAMSAAPALVMLSQGYAKRNMYLTILTASMISLSFILGISYGINGVSWGYTIASFLIMFPLIIFGFRETPIQIKIILKAIGGPLIATIPSAVATYLFIVLIQKDHLYTHIVAALIFFTVYSVLTLLRPNTRETLRSIVESALSMIRKKSSEEA